MPTHIPLSPEIKALIEREAAAQGLTFDEFLRQTLARGGRTNEAKDRLFVDTAVYSDTGPSDTAENHDEYLYGEEA
jgi:hypothetical protein